MSKHGKHIVPHAIEEFNSYILVVPDYLTQHQERLRVSDANLEKLDELINNSEKGWKKLHADHSNKAKKSELGNKNLSQCEWDITHLLHEIYADIPKTKLTIDDSSTLHISLPHGKRSTRAKIENIPFGHIYSMGGATVNFIVRMQNSSKKASMDPSADCIEVKGILLSEKEDIPTDPSQCNISFLSTKALFSKTFSLADAGKRFACFLRYVNTSDEDKSGGWSSVLICIVGL